MLVALALGLHYRYFSFFSQFATREFSGRRIFLRDSYTIGEVLGAGWEQFFFLLLSHGIPCLLLFLAFRLFGKGQTRPQESWPWLTPLSYAYVLVMTVTVQVATVYTPASSDEFSYYFQSRVLGMGALALPGVGPADFLQMAFIESHPWMSMYPPGWSAFLALFPQGLLWLGPPLISLMALFCVQRLAEEVVGLPAARLGTVLMALSSGFVWQGGTFFPNHALLVGLAGGMALYLYALREKKLVPACLGGLSLSWAFVTRPVETALFGAVVVVWFLLFRKSTEVEWGSLSTLIASGLVGCFAFGIFYRYSGGFYSFIEPDPPHHFVAALWNFWYPLIRNLAWWSPFYLTLTLYFLKTSRLTPSQWLLLLYTLATVGAFTVFIDNGQFEYGSRYWLAGWGMMAPLAGAGAERYLQGRNPRVLPFAVLSLLLYSVVPTSLLFQQARSRVPAPVVWVRENLPANSLLFVRSTPANDPTNLMQNLPEQEQRWLLFLEPERTRALRRVWHDRPAFVVDWADGRYRFTPFEEAVLDDSLSLMLAANHTARILGDRERALALWRRIQPEDPYYTNARLNCGVALFNLKRPQEALQEIELARAAGAPEPVVRSVLERFKTP